MHQGVTSFYTQFDHSPCIINVRVIEVLEAHGYCSLCVMSGLLHVHRMLRLHIHTRSRCVRRPHQDLGDIGYVLRRLFRSV